MKIISAGWMVVFSFFIFMIFSHSVAKENNSMNVDWKANWIWNAGDPQPRNYRLNARKTIHCKPGLQNAFLHISADSRYRLYVNGEWLGDGPARSFPHLQQFDSYDIAPYLTKGDNVVAVTVNHYGESTFHYNLGRAGLLCQIELDYQNGAQDTIVSDAGWKVTHNLAYETRSPRISCQMPFEENYDARRLEPMWTKLDFDDGAWENATVIGPVGTEPWKEMRARTIPFLSRVPYYPKRLVSTRLVHPVSLVETVNVRPYLLPDVKNANSQKYRGVIATEILSSTDQMVELARLWTIKLGEWRLNGKPIEPLPGEEGVNVHLRKGANLFIADFVGTHHYVDFSLAIDAKSPVEIRAPFGGKGKWLIVGPLAEDYEEAERISQGIWTESDLQKFKNKFHFSEIKDEAAADVWNITYSQKTVAGEPNIDQTENMFADNGLFTTVYPAEGDVEILLDFGQELVGFTEFEVDAPGHHFDTLPARAVSILLRTGDADSDMWP